MLNIDSSLGNLPDTVKKEVFSPYMVKFSLLTNSYNCYIRVSNRPDCNIYDVKFYIPGLGCKTVSFHDFKDFNIWFASIDIDNILTEMGKLAIKYDLFQKKIKIEMDIDLL